MIIAHSEKVLLMGFTRDNMERIMKGDPLLLTPEHHGVDKPIAIIFGETEEDMLTKLKADGIDIDQALMIDYRKKKEI